MAPNFPISERGLKQAPSECYTPIDAICSHLDVDSWGWSIVPDKVSDGDPGDVISKTFQLSDFPNKSLESFGGKGFVKTDP